MLKLTSRFILEVLPYLISALVAALVVPAIRLFTDHGHAARGLLLRGSRNGRDGHATPLRPRRECSRSDPPGLCGVCIKPDVAWARQSGERRSRKSLSEGFGMQIHSGTSNLSRRTAWWTLVRNGLMAAVSSLWLERPNSTYRPERHYMRGPGREWRAKYGRSAH